MSNHFSITARELAQMTDVSYDTIDHWAGLDLLPYDRVGRTRRFDPHLCRERCQQIRALQTKGHSLTTIKVLLQNHGELRVA